MRPKNEQITPEIRKTQYSFNQRDRQNREEENNWKKIATANYITDESVTDLFRQIENRDVLNSYLIHLRPRWRQVLEMRYGLIDSLDFSLEEIGHYFNITQERVRQIEAKSLRKILGWMSGVVPLHQNKTISQTLQKNGETK